MRSGYLGGGIDLLVSRIIDIMLAYPGIVFVIFVVTIFGRTFQSVSLAIGHHPPAWHNPDCS